MVFTFEHIVIAALANINSPALEIIFRGVLSAILDLSFTSGHLDCFSTTNQNRPSNGYLESRSVRQAIA